MDPKTVAQLLVLLSLNSKPNHKDYGTTVSCFTANSNAVITTLTIFNVHINENINIRKKNIAPDKYHIVFCWSSRHFAIFGIPVLDQNQQ